MSDLDVTISLKDGGYSAQLDRINRGIKQIQGSTKEMSSHSVTDVQAISASLRTMEGGITNSLRAAERFVAQSKLLSGIAQSLFPVAGGIAFAGIIGKMTVELVEFIKKTEELPQKIRDGFAALTTSQQTATDKLAVTNDRLEDQIAKLEGKPQNHLQMALHEARVEADELATSLERDSKAVQELIKQNKIGFVESMITGQQGSKDISDKVKKYEIDLNNLGHSHNADVHKFGADSDQAKASLKAVTDKQNEILNYTETEIRRRTGDVSYTVGPNGQQESYMPAGKGAQSYASRYGKQDFNLSILGGVRDLAYGEQDYASEQSRNKKDEVGVKRAEENKRNATEAAAAMKKIQAEMIQASRDQLEAIKADHATDLEEDRLYWYGKILTAKQGSKELESAQFNFNKTGKLINVRDSKQDEALDKATFGVGGDMDLSKDDGGMKDFQARSRISEENAHIANELATSIRDATAAFAEQNVQVALTTGNMSKYQAAVAMANIHTAQFDEKMNGANGLQYQLDNAKAGGDASQISAATRTVNLAKIQRDTQIQSDSQAIALNTPLGAATDALRQFAQAANDTGTQLRDLIGQALNGINSDIVNGKGFKQTGADLAKSVSTMGLQKAEGSVLGAFGLGGKPDGSSSKPLYTIDVTPGAGANGGGFGGGILGKLFGGSKSSDSSSSDSSGGGGVMDSLSSIIGGFGGNSDGSDSDSGSGFGDSFQGFFANGGDVVPNKAAIVGDGGGPELFIPKTAGSIVSNKQLGNLGGDTHYHVDARGATDPSATAKMVQQAMMQTHKQSVSDSLKAQKESNLRKPPSARS